ncbi:16S rRNA (guanine(527)-N(7))-methyltransferase RsmG [Pseudomonadales bacterium]|nr:16S rRNA (guanine(527)-N(7))-methyltransferase RsmG [Pseudomonadales bacterium]
MADGAPKKVLLSGCEKLSLKLSLKDSDRLLQYLNLMQKWNRTHNLTALPSIDEMVVKHLLDSLSIESFLPSGTVLDIGSGAGLPGIPLAVVRPNQQFTLVDASFKRVAFLREVKRRLKLTNIDVIHARVEQLPNQAFEAITSRAFSSLPEMLDVTKHLLSDKGIWMAMKGHNPVSELSNVQDDFLVEAVDVLYVPGLDAERHLVRISKCSI